MLLIPIDLHLRDVAWPSMISSRTIAIGNDFFFRSMCQAVVVIPRECRRFKFSVYVPSSVAVVSCPCHPYIGASLYRVFYTSVNTASFDFPEFSFLLLFQAESFLKCFLLFPREYHASKYNLTRPIPPVA